MDEFETIGLDERTFYRTQQDTSDSLNSDDTWTKRQEKSAMISRLFLNVRLTSLLLSIGNLIRVR